MAKKHCNPQKWFCLTSNWSRLAYSLISSQFLSKFYFITVISHCFSNIGCSNGPQRVHPHPFVLKWHESWRRALEWLPEDVFTKQSFTLLLWCLLSPIKGLCFLVVYSPDMVRGPMCWLSPLVDPFSSSRLTCSNSFFCEAPTGNMCTMFFCAAAHLFPRSKHKACHGHSCQTQPPEAKRWHSL